VALASNQLASVMESMTVGLFLGMPHTRTNSLTGYAGLDSQIIEIREALRPRFNIPPDYMARVLQDNEITEVLSERQFQTLVRAELRRRPEFGSALSEHPQVAGGSWTFPSTA
jgi:hypothetical protein